MDDGGEPAGAEVCEVTRPGERLRALAARVFGPTTMAMVIDPIVADWQVEYFRETSRARFWRAYWVLLRGYGGFICAVGLLSAGLAFRFWLEPSDDRRTVRRGLGVGATVTIALTGLLGSPLLWQIPAWNTANRLLVVALLVPSSLVLALPVGLVLGQLWADNPARRSWRLRFIVLAVASATSAMSFVLVGWISPAANQRFRHEILVAIDARDGAIQRPGRVAPRGINELTLSELHRGVQPDLPSGPRTLSVAYQLRLALAAAPLVLAFVGLTLTGSRRRRLAAGAAGGLAYFGYVFLLANGFFVGPPPLAVWAPLALLVATRLGTLRRAYLANA